MHEFDRQHFQDGKITSKLGSLMKMQEKLHDVLDGICCVGIDSIVAKANAGTFVFSPRIIGLKVWSSVHSFRVGYKPCVQENP